jgi:glycosyltransferase involved in cell wall biosynthesis
MSPHLLYIAFWYPPSRASGVYRALAVTEEFVAKGWDVTVMTTEHQFLEEEIGSTDPSLISHIPAEVDVVRVPFTFHGLGEDVRSLGWVRANFPTLWRAVRARTSPILSTISTIRGETPEAHQFVDKYVAWIDPVVKTGIRVDAGRAVDYVLATGNPYASFEAARLLASLLGTGYSIDYRDPWTIDVFTGRRDNADQKTTQTERRIVAEADLCFHVNEAIADAYGEKYPEGADKHRVAPNGFDADSIPPPSGPSTPPFTLGMLGTMNERWPITEIYEAWSLCRGDLPEGSELVFGGHLGYFAKSEDLLEAYLPDESLGFRHVGRVPKDAVAAFYAGLDVVILAVPGGPMVTSGKVYEALALGKPIVCVQEPDGGARRLLEGHPLAICVDPRPEAVRSGILAALDMAKSLDPETSRRAQTEAMPYERRQGIRPIVDEITNRVRSGQPA